MRRAALLLGVAGCFSKPPFREECPVNESPGMAIAGQRVSWPSLPGAPFIELGDETIGVPMPTALSLSGGTSILPPVPEGSVACQTEDRVGIAMYPLFQASGNAAGFSAMSLTKVATGPAYTSWSIHWAHDLTCGGNPNQARGDTRFSMFPDGRIVRSDAVTASTSSTVAVADCPRCMPSTEFILTTYIAFARERLRAIRLLPATIEEAVPMDFDGTPTANEGGCIVDTADARMTVLWDRPSPAGALATRFRVVTATPGRSEAVFVADLLRSPSIAAPSDRALRTTMVMGAPSQGTCDELLARARAVQNFPAITADGATIAAAPDGSYPLGDRAISVALHAQGAAVPPGFVIEVRMPGTSLQTSRDPADVIWQHDPATGTFHVFFRGGLPTDETITLTSGC